MDQPIDPSARATKFRFKGEKTKSSSPSKRTRPDGQDRDAKRPRRNRPDVNLFTQEPNNIDANDAFDESLFDALADHEGAAYWEKIYGQPIHIYERPTKFNVDTQMYEPVSNSEYVKYVQQKMWQHTHAGELEDMRRRKKEHEKRMAEEAEYKRLRNERRRQRMKENRLKGEMEEALRRGEARRRRQAREDDFARYTQSWETWDGTQDDIPWPTGSGMREDIRETTVRSFFTDGLGASAGSAEFAAGLKEQRVRWHPDKMQQKMGGKDKVAKGVMADITMVFQVIDTLYNDFRKASK